MPTTDPFGAIANPVRREILDLLRESSLTAGEIAGRFDLGRPAISEHLQVLRMAGLVVEEVQGRHRVYHLEGPGLAEVSDWLVPFRMYWKRRLRALEAALDKDDQ